MNDCQCPIVSDWKDMKQKFLDAVEEVKGTRQDVSTTNSLVREILGHVQHLEKLDTIASILGRVARNLLYAVVAAMVIFGVLLVILVRPLPISCTKLV